MKKVISLLSVLVLIATLVLSVFAWTYGALSVTETIKESKMDDTAVGYAIEDEVVYDQTDTSMYDESDTSMYDESDTSMYDESGASMYSTSKKEDYIITPGLEGQKTRADAVTDVQDN